MVWPLPELDAYGSIHKIENRALKMFLSIMQIKILSPLWGHEQVDIVDFLEKIRAEGYDGIDTWVPGDHATKKRLYDYLDKHQMHIVTHQHQALGESFNEFKKSFKYNLNICAEPSPILINSHTGRDYFSFGQNLELLDIANEFSDKSGILVSHETHRGRFGYSPQMIAEFFNVRKEFSLTADFSHWVCVTESMLDNFSSIIDEAILRSRHIHARVGFEEGPQVPHPGAPEWKYALDKFLSWWDRIVEVNSKNSRPILPITTEFGPVPYMPVLPFTNTPVASQFEVNIYMKSLLNERYKLFRSGN
jgi:sugar phosphate isomerase/epimerase